MHLLRKRIRFIFKTWLPLQQISRNRPKYWLSRSTKYRLFEKWRLNFQLLIVVECFMFQLQILLGEKLKTIFDLWLILEKRVFQFLLAEVWVSCAILWSFDLYLADVDINTKNSFDNSGCNETRQKVLASIALADFSNFGGLKNLKNCVFLQIWVKFDTVDSRSNGSACDKILL